MDETWDWGSVTPSDKESWPPWWRGEERPADQSKEDARKEAETLRSVIRYHDKLYYGGRREVTPAEAERVIRQTDFELWGVMYGDGD